MTEQAEIGTAGARAAGERIERLLEASSSGGPLARERAEELVRLVVELYGAGLERILEISHEAGALSDEVLEALAADDLVSSLLLVHGLHPWGVTERIVRALDRVRPYLGSHGGDVELIEVTDEGVARLRMLGSCDGCPSSAVTLSLAVEGAVLSAAPEVGSIEVVEAPAAVTPSVIPVEALTVRLHESSAAPQVEWRAVSSLGELASDAVSGVDLGGQRVVLVRTGSDVYAYADRCPHCDGELSAASLERLLGTRTVVLTCPGCRTHFDVRKAGAALHDGAGHLSPFPLLQRDGVVEVAVPVGMSGVPA